jgi:outer membrane protein OmpA-like peptidoglycan-associated protein
MSQRSDESQGFALLTVFSIVGLVVAGIVGFGSIKGHSFGFGGSNLEAPAAAATADAKAPKIYFPVADATLPPDANEALTRVADAARSDAQVRVRIVPFHDATGDSGAHSELARRRAWRVHHALESNGVPPTQLEIAEPVTTPASADPRDARRVEMHVR